MVCTPRILMAALQTACLLLELADATFLTTDRDVGSDYSVDADELCTICQECLGHSAARVLTECHHVFHAHCVEQWLASNRLCPLRCKLRNVDPLRPPRVERRVEP